MSFGVEIASIINFLKMDPRPAKPFNETLGFNGRFALSFNEMGNRLQPEFLRKNLEFFSALNICGVYPVESRLRPYFSKHNRQFNLLEGVQMTSTLEPVLGFKVPELDYPPLPNSICKNLMVKDGNVILGDQNHLLVRARPAIDGEEVVVFGIEYASGVRYYMWDVDSVYSVATNSPALFIRANEDDKLYLVSDVKENYYIRNVKYEKMVWTNFNKDLVQEEKIVIDVDFVKYEVDKVVTVALDVEDGAARDACNDKVFEVPSLPNGVYEFNAKDGSLVPKFGRRKVPDSPSFVTVARNCYTSMGELTRFCVIPRERKAYTDFFLNFRSDVTYASCLNSCTVKVPALSDGKPKAKRNKFELVKDFYQTLASKNFGLARSVPSEFEMMLYDNYLFVKRNQIFSLNYLPRIRFESSGLSNYLIKGYGVIVCNDLPIKNKNIFSYRDFYMVFYDPLKWKYPGEDRLEDFIDLNETL